MNDSTGSIGRTLCAVLCAAVVLGLAGGGEAANHYVRDGASGDGGDWSNAYGSLPSTLVRGDTYYVADGDYGGYTFDDPGTATITIKKATEADHGTSVGWNSSYGDGQALLGSGMTFKTGYYVLDGNGTHTIPSDVSADYGFKVAANSSTDWGGILKFGVAGGTVASNIDVRYLHVYNATNGSINNGTVLVRFTGDGPPNHIRLRNCFFENSGKDGIQLSSASYILIERCYLKRLGKLAAEVPDYHGQTVQLFYGGDDIIFRWNAWEANEGQGLIAIAGIGTSTERVRFYGNLVFVKYGHQGETPGFNTSGGVFGASWNYENVSGLYVYNNTMVNIGGDYGGCARFPLVPSGSGRYCYNNLMYNCEQISNSGWTDYSYHASGGGDAAGGADEQTGLSSSIFADYQGNDFQLAAATDAGVSLTGQGWWDESDAFFGFLDSDADMYGNTRGGDGNWDRGAFEYVSGGNQNPVADAGPDQNVEDTDQNGSENVTLDGSGSYDPDGSITSYVWEENSSQIATGVGPTASFTVAAHTVELIVTDNDSATDTDTVIITVEAPPEPQAPVADAGADQNVTDTDEGGDEDVTLDGSGSYDPDGSITGYVWEENSSQIATGVSPVVTLTVAVHTIDLTVTDNDSLTDTDSVVITVNAGGAPANIEFDAVSYGSDLDTSSLSWSHTIGGGGNRILIVGVENEDDVAADMVVSSVTYNGVAMSLVTGSQASVGSDPMNKTALYYLLDADLPAAGSYTVTVAYAGQNTRHCAGAISLANVAQQAAEAVAVNSNSNASAISTNITTLTDGAWVVDAAQSGHPSTMAVNASGMVGRYSTSGSGGQTGAGATKPVATAGPTTMSWDYDDTGTARLVHSAAAFAPAAGGPPANDPPTADAGPDQNVTDNDDSGAEDVTLDGSGSSDSDGAIVSYEWEESSVPIASGVSPVISLSVAVHTIDLTVTDDDSDTDSDSVQITVNPYVNVPPTADAGPDQNVTDNDDSGDEDVTLDGSGSSDSDGTIVSYEWDESSVPIATGVSPVVTLSVAVHTIDLIVTDDDNDTGTDSVTITVTAYVNVPPTADAGPDQNVNDADDSGDEDVTLDGSGSSDSDGTIVSYVWEENSSQIATGVSPLVTLSVAAHTIDLTVTDDDNDTDTDSVQITVTAYVNVPPTADAGPDQEVTDADDSGSEDVTLDGSGSSDSDGTIVSYVWEENSSQIATGVSPVVALSAAVHTIDLTVTDDDSATDSDSVVIAVAAPANQAPTVDAGAAINITMPANADLDGTVTDDGLPDPPAAATTTWTKVSGPGDVYFADAAAVDTRATVTVDGVYVLQLEAGDGELTTTDTVTVTVDPATGGAVTSTVAWQSFSIAAQTDVFTAEFDMVPHGEMMDGVTGLSLGTAAAYSDLACIVRFDSATGHIDVRNGSAYAKDIIIPFVVGDSYHVRMEVDIVNHLYDVFLTPEGSGEVQLADDYAFRTEQASVATLDHWSLKCAWGSHTVSNMTIVSDNTPPTADAGPDQNVDDTDDSGDEDVTLDGSGSSDSDGTIVSYAWEEDSSQIATGVSPVVTLNVAVHTIDLTVTDDDSATDSDSVVITVNAYVNQAPTADAGPDQEVTDTDDGGDEDVTLDGSGSSDSDGTITAYEWQESSVPIASGVSPVVTLDVAVHTIDLTVTDDDSATDSDSVMITVNAGGAPAEIAFDAVSYGSGKNGASLSWSHTIGGGANRILIVGVHSEDSSSDDLVITSVTYNSVTMSLVTGSEATVVSNPLNKTALYYLLDADLPTAGSYTIEVTFAGQNSRYSGGGISLAEVAQQAAEAVATNSNANASEISTNIITLTDGAWVVDAAQSGHPSTMTATASGMVQRYSTSGSGGQTGAGASKPVATAGSTTMSWDYDDTGTARLVHSVAAFAPAVGGPPANDPPIADAGPDQNVTDNDDNGSEDLTLDGSGSSDSDGTIVSYVWEENSSQIATGVSPVVTLSVAVHTIDLTVTDDDSDTDSDSVVITVNPHVNVPPTADAGPDQNVTDTDEGGDEDVTLDGSGSSDSDGSIVSYVWEENSSQIATGVSPTVTLSVAVHTIDLTVTDDDSATDSDSAMITVNAPANIEFDAVSSDAAADTSSLSWSHTIGNGDNRILIVGVHGEDSSSADLVISSVTYNSVAMSLVTGSEATVVSDPLNKTALYYLLDADLPATGTYTVEATYAGEITRQCAGAISLANVAQQAAEAVVTNTEYNASEISTSITTLTDGAWVVDAAQSGHPSTMVVNASGMVGRYSTSGSGGQTGAGSTKLVSSAGPTTMSWDYNDTGTARLTHSVAAFAPAIEE